MKVLNREQTQCLEADQVKRGSTYYELMENAGVQAGKILINRFSPLAGSEIAILCGKGNNGGDGFVAAKYLKTQGLVPIILLVDGEPRTADAARAFQKAVQNGVTVYRYWAEKEKVLTVIKQVQFVIDAVYGIGFSGALKPELCQLANEVNAQKKRVLAVDLPSGVDCDTGAVENTAFIAEVTVSFTTMKAGQMLYPAMDYCAEVAVAQVGINKWLISESACVMQTIEKEELSATLPAKKKSANKGSVGTLLSVCGSYGMAGACTLANKAALLSGIGLLKAALPYDIYSIVAQNIIESVFLPLKQTQYGTISKQTVGMLIDQAESCNAVLVGCGLGKGEDVEEIVCQLIRNCKVPIIIDADGINALAKHIHVLRESQTEIVLTPHPGEMARLLRCGITEIQKNRLTAAKAFAQKFGVTVVLKGANTIVASAQGECKVNTTGNAGMAKGGSGDVLAGMTAAFLAQGANPFSAAKAAVYCHGVAADMAKTQKGILSMQPSDILLELQNVYKSINLT